LQCANRHAGRQNRCQPRLRTRIRNFGPNVLIVHGGFVFRRFANEFLSVLKSVKREFPDIRIGLERLEEFPFVRSGDDDLDFESIIETSAEMSKLIDDLTRCMRGPEV